MPRKSKRMLDHCASVKEQLKRRCEANVRVRYQPPAELPSGGRLLLKVRGLSHRVRDVAEKICAACGPKLQQLLALAPNLFVLRVPLGELWLFRKSHGWECWTNPA
jgi:hypothetical protein